MTCPLLTKSDGTKMGKTESGTLWLSPERPAPINFYQYWINLADADVGKCLRFFTELRRGEIDSVERGHAADPGRREAQRGPGGRVDAAGSWRRGTGHGPTGHRDLLRRRDPPIFPTLNSARSSPTSPARSCPDRRLDGGRAPLDRCALPSGPGQEQGRGAAACSQGGATSTTAASTKPMSGSEPEDLASETTLVFRAGKRTTLLRFVSV